MTIFQKIKQAFFWLIAISGIVATIFFGIKLYPKASNLEFLPTESILVKEIQSDIENNVTNALLNIMDRSDFELAIHVNLNQDEITEEQIKYEPKEISTSQLTKNLTPIPKVNALPGLVDNPFHNESLPGFPSYFDQFDIEKDDYITRGMFAKILSTAYQLPKKAGDLNNDLEPIQIIDSNESEFADSIQSVISEDILTLYQSGEFRPNQFLSKASLITALVRINYPTSNYYSQDVISDLPYKDIPRNYWAYNYIKTALEHKLIEEDILFNPNKKISVEETLELIEKTPLRSDIFNYYKFPKKNTEQLFRTDNKKEITESNVYYNQEKTYYKQPSTKIKNISIRLLVNQVVLSDTLTIENIEDIVLNTVDINVDRNDSLIIKSYRFTNLPFLTRAYKWAHWQKIYILILVTILGFFVNRLYTKYKQYKLNQEKIALLNKQKEEKLAKIYEEEE
ncbi:MAG: S-layer homology domain-containing protein, partial [Candidatus Margulisiibacteriota bacterium]